jgi:hypothetical protein
MRRKYGKYCLDNSFDIIPLPLLWLFIMESYADPHKTRPVEPGIYLMDFSRAEALLMASSGRATSMSFFF